MTETLSGQTINDYIIGPLIGIGGMSEVYQAYAPDNSDPIAIKILRIGAVDANLQQRFLREIGLMETLKHHHIVPILDYGTTDHVVYFTMKLISGITLASLMQRQHFSPLGVWKILRQVSSALAYVHEQNIVHRDVKPGNVFLERQDNAWHVYLGDFGLGKNILSDEILTVPGSSLGTLEYMSPEGALGAELDQAADVYSLAVIVYEMLLNTLPVKYKRPGKIAPAELLQPPTPPTEYRPDFPRRLERVLLRGLAKDKSKRYQTVREFGDAYYDTLVKLSREESHAEYAIADDE